MLMSEWDPIGVGDEPMAADEYDSYIGDVLQLLERKASAKAIYDYLQQVETQRMGLTDLQGRPLVPRERREKAVNALLALTARFHTYHLQEPTPPPDRP